MFDQIEKLKREFTDKYVVVDEGRPELARFKGKTGLIKTVNMSGKALVNFEGDNNIGWYDIGLDFLKVVPKPEPKPEEEKHAKKAPAAKADAPKPAAAPAGEKKMSIAEQLKAQAAAKAAAAAAPAAPKPVAAPEPEPATEAAAEEPVVEAPAAAPKPAVKSTGGDGKKLSTAEILAALRAKKS